jgi:hypothetical protein
MDRIHDAKPNLRAINTGRHALPSAASAAELQSVSLNGGISSSRSITEDQETPTSARSTAM